MTPDTIIIYGVHSDVVKNLRESEILGADVTSATW